MPFVSYAQNFEDVLLWRALGDVQHGFFIDVGAHHPDRDSVTRAFSDRGWRGVNIEPLEADAALIRAARPRDVTLQVAVGAENGALPFHAVEGTGLSTLDAGIARAHADGRFAVSTRTVPVLTLAHICRLHAPDEIHFLKIDVEGAEAAVLRGADFERFRPWIVLAEATEPLGTRPMHQGWEPILLAADYRFAWFDGLNRFYVALERAEQLLPAFRTPPNVFDDFVRAADSSWIGRFDQAALETRVLREQLRSAQHGLEQSALRERRHVERAGHDIDRLREALGRADGEAALSRQRADTAEHVFALRHRDVEELHAALHQARHELQQTHLRLQAAEAHGRDAVREAQRRLDAAADRQRAALERSLAALERSQAALRAVLNSRSWRITAPQRRGKGLEQVPEAWPEAWPEVGPDAGPPATLPATEPAAADPVREAEPAGSRDAAPATADAAVPPGTGGDALPDAAGFAAADAGDATEAPLPPLPIVPPPFLVPVGGAAAGLRVVHQLHSGSAVNDAITNSLLLMRDQLRGMGFESEIFVEQPPPALAHLLRTFEQLPRHDRYVLIQHHSIGYDRFEQVLALPAPRVLVYHNITPPALLGRHPHLAHYARLGRQQLERFRGRVSSALAVSDYNALELRRLGLGPVRACCMLFDLDRLRARAASATAALRRDGVFTVLFVGRINESKNQHALIEAYARFAGRLDTRSRLVLVGRAEAEDDPYLLSLRRRIASLDPCAEVVLTGGVPDETLDGWYEAADLFVSLSLHEGFGVPLVEAMAHGVPVLALPAGAVPFTLAGSARLLEDASAGAVAEAMLALARDPAARERQRDAQRASLDRFGLERQRRVLLDALLRAGAQPPEQGEDAASRAPPRFSVTGHVNGSYSLAAINRSLALALEAARPGRVRLLPNENGATLDLSGVPVGQRDAIAALAQRPPHATGPELVISQHYPVLVPDAGADLAAALLFWEESRLPADTVALLGRHFNAVVAPTRFVREALVESGLPIPARVIPPAPDLDHFAALRAHRRPAADGTHRFLHVSSCFPRKGVDVLLRAWARAFRAGDAVSLVIKGFANPHNQVAAQLDALRAGHPGLAPVTLIDADLDEAAVLSLFRDADTMVLPTRGEGLNLPAAEALAAGLGLIVTGAGGHMDFCARQDASSGETAPLGGVRLLRYRHAPSCSHLATPHSLWFEPDEADLVAALRERAAAGSVPVEAPALPTPDALAEGFETLARDLLREPPRQPVRVSWVSSWGVRCGVAEYSRHLLAGFGGGDAERDGHAVRVRVLCDRRTPPAEGDPDAAWPCWAAGDPRSLAPLAAAIGADDADAVMLQHQPGLLPFGTLAALIEHPSLSGRTVLATLHNTVDLLDLAEAERARVLAALGGLARVLVHTVADLDRLRALGLRQRVTLLPHGVPEPMPAPAPRPLDGERARAAPLIGCYGFFLPGKGIDALIEAVALLRRRWPGAELLLVNAEYDGEESREEIRRCRALAQRLGVAGAVRFETGFLPNQASLDLLAGCDLLALPYAPSREASSAALRGAMAAGVPVAVTPVALFDEAGAAVFRFAGGDPASIAAGLDGLLRDHAARVALQAEAQRWMAERRWSGIARQLEGMIAGLVRDARLGGGN